MTVQSYNAVCPDTRTASDGTSQPAGTVLFRFQWDGVSAFTPVDAKGLPLNAVLDAAQAVPVYQPVSAAPVTISPLEFMARLTAAEQTAITTAAQSNAQVMLFLLKLAGAQTVDVTDPLTIGGVNTVVAAGLLTQTRATQILNLAVPSP